MGEHSVPRLVLATPDLSLKVPPALDASVSICYFFKLLEFFFAPMQNTIFGARFHFSNLQFFQFLFNLFNF
jgi:hypothetical protein